MLRISAATLVLLIAGCRAAGPIPDASTQTIAPSPSEVSRQGWVRRTLSAGWRDVPPYSVEVPPKLERVDVQGIDSDTAWLSGPGVDLHFDYGMYSGFGGCDPGSRCTSGETVIGGKKARTLAVERATPDEEGRRWFYSVEIPVTAAPPGPMGIDLVAHAQCSTASACDRAAAMLRTIEFRSAGPVMAKTKAAPPPPPQPPAPEVVDDRPCIRVGAGEARAFQGLELLGRAPGWEVYGRRGQMICTPADASGAGSCQVTGASQIRLEFPSGTSGFRTTGRLPVVVRFKRGEFGCAPREAR